MFRAIVVVEMGPDGKPIKPTPKADLDPKRRFRQDQINRSHQKCRRKNKGRSKSLTPPPKAGPSSPLLEKPRKRQRRCSKSDSSRAPLDDLIPFDPDDHPTPSGQLANGMPVPEAQPRAIDYARSVHGNELSPDAPVTTWPGGAKTVLPFIRDPKNPEVNMLAADQDAVYRFSKFPGSRDSPFIVHIPFTNRKRALTRKALEHLSHGQTVVIDNAAEVEEIDFSLEYAIVDRKIGTEKPYSIHYASHRTTDVEHPQRPGSLETFFGMLPQHSEIGCILDVPSSMNDSPEIIGALDDGHPAYQSLEDIFSKDLYRLKDTQNTRNWELIHTGGFHTFEHHDAEGFATFVRIRKGCKMWGIAQPAGYDLAKTREELTEMNKLFIRGTSVTSWMLKWEEQGGIVNTIVAEPGSVVIMPPGTWHLVYTPVGTHASGGHIYMYDTLHLTEISRWFDREHGFEVTNTSHISAYMTLCMMMCHIVRMSKQRKFYRKCVQALCRMVLHHEEYIVQAELKSFKKVIEQNAKTKDQSKLARIVAGHLVDYFGFKLSLGKHEDYLFQVNWLEPGPTIDLKDACSAFNGTALLRNSTILGDSTIPVKDIISGAWTPKRTAEPDSISMEYVAKLDSINLGNNKRRSKRKGKEKA
ncbi:hypothetical protein BD779DRAFT_1681290 [Infundibulicybe gibba]|nr:hypothetical protein BD779DRAFT_1681290 [Infundibulicybe gibba]